MKRKKIVSSVISLAMCLTALTSNVNAVDNLSVDSNVSLQQLNLSDIEIGSVDKIMGAEIISSHYEKILNDPEWIENEDRIERGKMLQFSNDVLSSMDTDVLIEAVLEYPFFSDIYFFDDINIGIEALFASFNGIQELSIRDGAAQAILQKYSEEKILTLSEINTPYAGKKIKRLSNLEVLLAQDFVIENLNEVELMELNEMLLDKYQEKSDCPEYGTVTTMFYDLFTENCSSQYAISEIAIPYSTSTTVKTPNGTSVSVETGRTALSAIQIQNYKNDVATNYPSAIFLGNPSNSYNCHSYAWYKQSTSNTYWMYDPSAYWTDGSYSTVSTRNSGNKMVWFDLSESPCHSGCVTAVYSGPSQQGFSDLVDVTSKWGPGGLYNHKGNNTPYATITSAFGYYSLT